jgi:hypothetical protein
MKLSKTLHQRFFAKTAANPETGCLEWTGALNNIGYGMVSIATGTSRPAHRVAWFLAHGKWPSPQALHHCDNRKCVNILHLFEGTQQDNRTDAKRKGRVAFGEQHGMHKLTTDEVQQIRKLKQLSLQFKTCESNVSFIARGETRQLG